MDLKVLSILLSVAAGLVVHPEPEMTQAFDKFISKYQRSYKKGSSEYQQRMDIFTMRVKKAELLNSQPGRGWKAGASAFADYTPQELAQLKGWKGMAPRGGSHGHLRSQVSLLQTDLPEDWQKWTSLKSLQEVVNQGACGSCWAVTSATVLNSHREIHHNVTEQLSAQELVACVPNPRNCGGAGGCSGATVELAMAYTMEKGLATDAVHPYKGIDETCRSTSSSLTQLSDSDLDDLSISGVRKAASSDQGLHALKMHGWEKLPENKYVPLMRALVEKGPVAVSVSADGWEMYLSGIYGDCSKDAVIDHAVTLIAYGKDEELNKKYWTIMNSWGEAFGEKGTLRLLRQDSEEEYCGTDHQPQVGTGCDGGPASVRVCGMCGILYDNVVPLF